MDPLADGSLRGVVESKTVTVGLTEGSESTVGSQGTGFTTTTAATTAGVKSRLFGTTFKSCDQVNDYAANVTSVYGKRQIGECANDSQCKAFHDELLRVANRLGCLFDPTTGAFG